jgi:hypothetical protein
MLIMTCHQIATANSTAPQTLAMIYSQLLCDALNASRAPPQTSLSLLPLLLLLETAVSSLQVCTHVCH